MYPIITVFGREIGSYILCVLVGLLVSGTFFGVRGKKIGLHSEDVVLLLLIVAVGMAFGGSLLYGLLHAGILIRLLGSLSKYSLQEIWQVLQYCFGGSVFYGGLIGATTGFFLYARKYDKEKQVILRDLFAMSIPLFHTFGRIGCFFGGCCYGIPSKFGVTVHNNPLVPELNDVCRFPVALAESALDLGIFLVLFALNKKGKLKGKLIALYGLLYAMVRFSLEFLRGDVVRGFLWGLSTSQWISMILFIACSVYLAKVLYARSARHK